MIPQLFKDQFLKALQEFEKNYKINPDNLLFITEFTTKPAFDLFKKTEAYLKLKNIKDDKIKTFIAEMKRKLIDFYVAMEKTYQAQIFECKYNNNTQNIRKTQWSIVFFDQYEGQNNKSYNSNIASIDIEKITGTNDIRNSFNIDSKIEEISKILLECYIIKQKVYYIENYERLALEIKKNQISDNDSITNLEDTFEKILYFPTEKLHDLKYFEYKIHLELSHLEPSNIPKFLEQAQSSCENLKTLYQQEIDSLKSIGNDNKNGSDSTLAGGELSNRGILKEEEFDKDFFLCDSITLTFQNKFQRCKVDFPLSENILDILETPCLLEGIYIDIYPDHVVKKYC